MDEYSRNARLKPAFVVILPIALTIAVLGFRQSALEGVLLGLASSLGFPFLLVQFVRDKGASKEPALFLSWGGKPSTAMLRYGDERVTPQTKQRYYTKLAAMLPDLDLLTVKQEPHHERCDAICQSCVDYLLSRTRDKERFQLLFQENINYGFRRNLWSVKPAGIAVSLASLGALCFIAVVEAHNDSMQWFPLGTALTLTLVLTVWWLFGITDKWVKTAADRYAIRLLSAIDDLPPDTK